MEETGGLNYATTFDVVMGVLYGISAVVLIATAYVIYTKQFRRKKLQEVDTINFVTARYNIYTEKTQLLIEVPKSVNVELNLLDENEKIADNLLSETLDKGEHIVIFDPKQYQPGLYYFSLKSESTTILKKIKIT